MIRRGKVHAISCTAANLEEDVFNLFAHGDYRMIPNYRDLRPEDERALRDEGLNRVTDTCIPETVMRHTEAALIKMWAKRAEDGTALFPSEYLYELLDDPEIRRHFAIPSENSWVLAAKDAGIPVYSPGWEDSTVGNIFTASVMRGDVAGHGAVRAGTEQLEHLASWYRERSKSGTPVGFFQIGGGIAGDFSICVVPMLIQDLREDAPFWAYFAQISDSTMSYGSYSGAVPNEKITWYKLDVDAPKFMINSDASIVAPLIFAYVLGE
jgi:deoxyhypusine synthase